MRTLAPFFILLPLAAALAACSGIPYVDFNWSGIRGSGHVITETRDVSGFTSLVVNGTARLNVDRTGRESLSITTDDNIMPELVTVVRGSTLYVELAPGVKLERTTDLTVNVTAKEFNALELNGAVLAEVKGLDADQLQVDVSGASAVKLSGKADRQDVRLNGTGAYDAENLEARSVTVKHNGAGPATVRVSETLNAEINGVGYVEYIGSPTVRRTIRGMGVVRQR